MTEGLLPLNRISGFSASTQGTAITGLVKVSSNTTFTEPLWLFGTLQPQNGVVVSINGPMVAGSGQIFDLSAGGSIEGFPDVENVYPSWWGADPSGKADSSPGINAALAFCTGRHKPSVNHLAGHYLCLDPIRKPNGFACPIIRGVGGGSSNLADDDAGTVWDFSQCTSLSVNANGDAGACVTLDGMAGVHCRGGIQDIMIVGNGASTGLCFQDQCGAFAQRA